MARIWDRCVCGKCGRAYLVPADGPAWMRGQCAACSGWRDAKNEDARRVLNLISADLKEAGG